MHTFPNLLFSAFSSSTSMVINQMCVVRTTLVPQRALLIQQYI